MGTTTELQALCAKLDGKPVSALERQWGNYRRDNVIPTAQRGGRSGSVWAEADHSALAILGFAADRPSESSTIVRQLDSLPCRGSIPSGRNPPGQHLGTALVGLLNEVAVPLSRGEPLSPLCSRMIKTWELSLCPDSGFAQMKMDLGEGVTAFFFHVSNIASVPVRRLTILTGDVLLAVSKLLATTFIHQNALAAVQFLDATKPAVAIAASFDAAADAKQKADTSSQEVPALSVGQTRATESGSVPQNVKLSLIN